MNESKIQECLSDYKHPVTTKAEIMHVLKYYRSLQGKMDRFVFNNGIEQRLFCLDGTVPVQFKGNSYNIPVCVWIMRQHPMQAPLVFVRPTQGMRIEVSRHVDHNGKVYMPYLSDWKQGTSDLVGLIQVMIIVFSERPPVYACRDGGSHYNQQSSQPLPYPLSQPGYPSSVSAARYPYPTPGPSSALPYPTQSPPYPQQQSAASSLPYPTAGGPMPPYGNQAGLPYPQPMVQSESVKSDGNVTSSVTSPSPVTQSALGAGTISEDHIRASLLSAVEDKVRRRVREQRQQVQAELEVLSNTQSELQQNKQTVEAAVQQLKQHKTGLEERLSLLRGKNAELEANVARLDQEEQLDVDEAVLTTAPLYKQLLASFAEENATQDAIYHLGEALNHGVIDLGTLLKHTRILSRRQFMLRATIQRCRKKAGLAC